MPLDAFGCDLATGRRDRDGYAFHGSTRAHIAAYVARYGPVPPGLEVDHMCRRRSCRSWWHLEAVTRSENEKRKRFGYRAKRTTCPCGHDLAGNRAVTPEGGVVCRICNREHSAVT
jgi:hypothetical protein